MTLEARESSTAWSALNAPSYEVRPFVALGAILQREALRFLGQRGRLVAALVRPLVWLLVFAAGFRAALGLSITPPYKTYITYETYIVPGLVGMILLFNGMQSSLSLVYDREMGSMRLLLRWKRSCTRPSSVPSSATATRAWMGSDASRKRAQVVSVTSAGCAV